MPLEIDDGQSKAFPETDAFALVNRLLDDSIEANSFEDFGPYRIEKPIGKGGMGEVYLACEERSNRIVAIKFLSYSWARPDLNERFAREIRTLAKLEHPFIARLYGAGIHPDGAPYFAMEYVEGKPLDEYCRERRLSVEERLRLFRSVCEAVQYAHSHLIVHRDLKPSNILVKDDGTPKLLDFGIAKQLEDLERTAHPAPTELRFTRAYAAPEQIRGQPAGVYTDVYALGVILYELLTGNPPYDLAGLTPVEADVLITSGREPEKPSAVANRRSGHVSRLSKAAWNDLNLVCLTALAKDIHERYASAGVLAQDVDLFLGNQPLRARPATSRYRIRKFIRRNRRAVLASAAVFLLIAGLTCIYTRRLARARDKVLAEAVRAQRVERFMLNLFDSGDKEAGPSSGLHVVTLLNRGTQQAQSLNNEPAMQAELYQTLGTMYQKLGQFDRAESLLSYALEKRRAVFGPDHEEVAGSMLALGLLRMDEAKLSDADRLIKGALAIYGRRLSPEEPPATRATTALGRLMNELGRYDEAIRILSEAVKLQSGPAGVKPDLAASLVDLGDAHFYLGHYAISDSLNQQALAIHRQLHGDIHPLVANDLVNLGNIQFQLGRYAQAERYDRRALAISQSWYGRDHPETARDAVYVAQALIFQTRYQEAETLLSGTLEALEQSYGKAHPRAALVLNELGTIAQLRGNLGEAATDFDRVAQIYRKVYGEQHQMTANALGNLATIYLKQGHYAKAESLLRDVIGRLTMALPAGHVTTAIVRVKLGRALVLQKRFGDAEVETRQGYDILATQTSPSVDWLIEARKDLIKEYEALGKPEKAAEFQKELKLVRKAAGPR